MIKELLKLNNGKELNFAKFPIEIKDSNGDIIYSQKSNGDWFYQECDSNGNQTYYEDYDGHWYKKEYDSNNNEIYYENHVGYWCKYEYDSNNNIVYWHDSDGNVEDKEKSKN